VEFLFPPTEKHILLAILNKIRHLLQNVLVLFDEITAFFGLHDAWVSGSHKIMEQ
jgi:hypothetical protein